MPEYVRPVIIAPAFHDEHGVEIRYGDRWGMDAPPDDTYSVVTHPERFAPLHTVADALVAHLVEIYQVRVEDGPDVLDGLAIGELHATRGVQLTPADPDAAVIAIGWTAYPGVVMSVGHDAFVHPICGCDACDETWEPLAENLERTVLGAVRGQHVKAAPSGPMPPQLGERWMTQQQRPDVLERTLAPGQWTAYADLGDVSDAEASATARPPVRRDAADTRDSDRWLPWPRRR